VIEVFNVIKLDLNDWGRKSNLKRIPTVNPVPP
jgi:hypothetical protein